MWRLRAVLIVCLCVVFGAVVWAHASDSQPDAPAWVTPPKMDVKRVGPLSLLQNQPTLFSNLDCSPLEYRVVNGSSLQTGCFTPTAFGQIDSDNDTVIYNGTDEALPLLPHAGNEILAPWPQAGVLVDLSPALVGGTYISLYRDPLTEMHNERDGLGELESKQLTSAPDLQLKDPVGNPLVINPQSLAFSDEGSWLVAEDLSGSFVRINLATLDMLPFAPAYGSTGSPALLHSEVAISQDGRYVAINNEAAGAFKVYDLSTCAGASGFDLAPLSCKSYDYRSFVAQRIPGLQSISRVRFVNDGLLSFEARTGNIDSDGVYELAPSTINSLIDYLGLGDSYTSGEGAFDYLAGTDSGDSVCHLSINSYPLLITRDLFGSQGGHSVACSGAAINDIGDLSGGYRGQVKGVGSWQQLGSGDSSLLDSVMAGYLPGYVAQERFVQQYQPGIATVSVGGNDVGFGDILQECVEPKVSLHISADNCFGTYEDRLELKNLIDRTVPRWTGLYQNLRGSAPGMRLYVIGYPQIVSDTGSCGLNVHLSQSELEFTEETIDYLNGDIKQAASKAGLPYVDISQALNGYRLCEAPGYDVAVNGLTAGKDAGPFGVNVFGKESYHPNALGQRLIEQSILKQTNNFKVTGTDATPPPDGGQLLNAPKTGRAVYTRLPVSTLTSSAAKAGQGIAINLDGESVGLPPNSTYTVHLDGPTGAQIGSVTSDGSGTVSGSGTIPSGTNPGGHTVDVTGTGQAGDPVDITEPIYVPVSSGDSDGDGLPDDNDSCPYAVNSGVDSDKDGIDDACDPLIGPPPASGPANPGASNTSDGNSSDSDNAASINDGFTGEPLITVADFSVGTSGTAARVLGGATADPNKILIKNFHSAALKQGITRNLPLLKLPAFDWLRWLILPVLIWWLLALLYLAVRAIKWYRFRLQ